MSLQDTQYLAPCDTLHLGDPVRITKDDTDLRGSQTLLGKLADVLLNLKGRIQIHNQTTLSENKFYRSQNRN